MGLGNAGTVAEREIRERVRGRVFRAGTLLVIAAVVLAIVIPTLGKSGHNTERIGVVGSLAAPPQSAVTHAGEAVGASVRLVPEPGTQTAQTQLRAGRVQLVLEDGRTLLVDKPISSTDTALLARLARAISTTLGTDEAIATAGLTSGQAAALATTRPLPVDSLQAGPSQTARTVSLVGLPLLLFMFLTYNSWILYGVMEEKSSRVVEVLLATVRPIHLLAGKVLGIGLVALAQAALIVAAALLAAKATGSDVAHGSTPLFLASCLGWLLLGYAFYCWAYAAAGSMSERREQVMTLIVPLNLPIVFGYIVALTAQSSGTATTLVKVLAYLPPTAPFAMPTLVSLKAVTWWQFAGSVAISVLFTIVVARIAATLYQRAILRTGRRVGLRELLSSSAAP